MKKTNAFWKLRRSDAYLFMKFYHRETLQYMIPTKIWKVLQRRHATVGNRLLISKQLLEKVTKYKRPGVANQRNIARKDTTHQLIKTPPNQIPDIVINKRTKILSYY